MNNPFSYRNCLARRLIDERRVVGEWESQATKNARNASERETIANESKKRRKELYEWLSKKKETFAYKNAEEKRGTHPLHQKQYSQTKIDEALKDGRDPSYQVTYLDGQMAKQIVDYFQRSSLEKWKLNALWFTALKKITYGAVDVLAQYDWHITLPWWVLKEDFNRLKKLFEHEDIAFTNRETLFIWVGKLDPKMADVFVNISSGEKISLNNLKLTPQTAKVLLDSGLEIWYNSQKLHSSLVNELVKSKTSISLDLKKSWSKK